MSSEKTLYIDTKSTEYLMAAAQHDLYIYYLDTRILEKHNVATMKKESAKRLRDEVTLTLLTMGALNTEDALVSYATATEAHCPVRRC